MLTPFDEKRVILITSPTYWSEMTHQVAQMGYSPRTQVFSLGAGAKKAWWVFVLRVIRAAKGSIALRRLARGPDGRRTVFLTPVPPAGDVYVECLFIREFVRRNGVKRFVIVVPNGACRRMVELFGFDDVLVRDENVLWKIVDYARFARRGPEDLVVMHYPSLNGSVAQMQGYKGLNFEKMFRYASFDLDEDVPHELPSVDADPDAVRATLVSHGLRPGGRSSSLHTPAHSYTATMSSSGTRWRQSWSREDTTSAPAASVRMSRRSRVRCCCSSRSPKRCSSLRAQGCSSACAAAFATWSVERGR